MRESSDPAIKLVPPYPAKDAREERVPTALIEVTDTPLPTAPVARSTVPASLTAAPRIPPAALIVLTAGACGKPVTRRAELEPGEKTAANPPRGEKVITDEGERLCATVDGTSDGRIKICKLPLGSIKSAVWVRGAKAPAE